MTGNQRVHEGAISATLEAILEQDESILEVFSVDTGFPLIEWYGVEDEENARGILRDTFRLGFGEAIPLTVRAV